MSRHRLAFLLSFCVFLAFSIPNKPLRWCHRGLPVKGGVFKFEAPYWKYAGCSNQAFEVEEARLCLNGRTIYVIGNSIARQYAFGIYELLGGDQVSRHEQKTKCPKLSVDWGDSCHQEFANVKIKYLYLHYMDGTNYTSRGGAPFWRQRRSFAYPNGTEESLWVTDRSYRWSSDHYPLVEIDNCQGRDTRSCLRSFFEGSTDEDVLIFTLGMAYRLNTTEEELERELLANSDDQWWDTRAWLVASAINFKAHLAATFKGHVFRVTQAQTNKFMYVSSWTPKLRETDRVLGQLWQIDSTSLHEMWHTIDQWSINEGRDELYNDQIHFNGPLSKATLQQVLNELCLGQGSASSDLEIWPRIEFRYSFIKGSNSSIYFVDDYGYRHMLSLSSVREVVPWLPNDNITTLSNHEIEKISLAAPFPLVAESSVVRGSTREVYWILNGTKHMFRSGGVFLKYGFEWDQIVGIPDMFLNAIPHGIDVE